jgi:hypothetical protein
MQICKQDSKKGVEEGSRREKGGRKKGRKDSM